MFYELQKLIDTRMQDRRFSKLGGYCDTYKGT